MQIFIINIYVNRDTYLIVECKNKTTTEIPKVRVHAVTIKHKIAYHNQLTGMTNNCSNIYILCQKKSEDRWKSLVMKTYTMKRIMNKQFRRELSEKNRHIQVLHVQILHCTNVILITSVLSHSIFNFQK